MFRVSGFEPTFAFVAGILAAAFVAAAVITYGVRKLAGRWRVFARRDGRRRHLGETPLLGGTAIYAVLVATTVAAYAAGRLTEEPLLTARAALCFIGAITLVWGIGVVDDVRELKAIPKLSFEVAAAILILVSRPELPPILKNAFIHPALVVPLLIVWIVGVTNALNMLDGLDGLCAGIGAIASLTLCLIALSTGGRVDFPVMVALALAGAAAGFLLHNFHPARIFLGDSGSLLIGFALAVVSIQVEVKRSLFISLSLPLFLLGVPLIDAALSIFRRRRLDRSVFRGDRGHIHHRLRQIGMSHRSVVVLLWVVSAYLGATAYFLAQVPVAQSVHVYVSVVPALGLWFMALYYLERRLSYQAVRFSHIFLKQELVSLSERRRLVDHVRARIRDGDGFAVVVVDCSHFMGEMAAHAPSRMVQFYMNLYSILRERLRSTDLVARVSDHVFASVIGGLTPGKEDGGFVGFLQGEIRKLQETNDVFQADSSRPTGFSVLYFPRDRAKILETLKIRRRELAEEQEAA